MPSAISVNMLSRRFFSDSQPRLKNGAPPHKTTGVDSTFIYTVEPAGGGSQVTADVVYEVPQGVLAKIADKTVVERMNERDADKAAQSLKTILDS